MEEKLEKILLDLNIGYITVKVAKRKILRLFAVSGSIKLEVGMEVLIKNNPDNFYKAAGTVRKITKELSNYDKKRAFELEDEYGIWLIEDFEYCISKPNFEMI
jgi:hypothetical protein